jgi:hypothetical protein
LLRDTLPSTYRVSSEATKGEVKEELMAEVSARATALAEEHQYRYHYSWLGDYLERLEGKEAYREFQNYYLGTEQGNDPWRQK